LLAGLVAVQMVLAAAVLVASLQARLLLTPRFHTQSPLVLVEQGASLVQITE
jgi:hypothetical protein